MDRRNFIKLTAVTGGAVTLASCGNPEHELIRFVPDEDLTPGLAEIKNGVCPQCSAGCGTTVRVMQGDVDTVRDGQAGVVTMSLAKKLEGNPTHPVNQGTLCPRGQAAIQIAYHPDRITQPLKRRGARGSNDFQPITWDAAIAELVGQLDTLASSKAQSALACWTRPGSSARRDLTALFLARFGAPPPTTFELFSDDVLRRANEMSFGREQLPTFDLAASRYVISFGADFLGTWNSPVAHTAALRPHATGPAGHSRCVRPGGTAHVADRRERGRMGRHPARHRRRPRAGPRARHHARQAAARGRGRPGGRARRRVGQRPRRLHAAGRRAENEREGRARRAARARAGRPAAVGGHHRRRGARAGQRTVSGARRQRAQRPAWQRRHARRPLVHAAGRRRIGHGEDLACCRRGYPRRRQAARAGAARRSASTRCTRRRPAGASRKRCSRFRSSSASPASSTTPACSRI